MKIAHVLRSLDPIGGGPPIMVSRLAAELARQGQDARVIYHTSTAAQERISDMIKSLPGAELVKYQPLNSGVGELSQILADARIVHLHGVWDPVLKASASVAHKRKIPFVITPHGMLDPWSLSQKRWKKKIALALGYRAMLNRAAFLHVLNRDEINLLARLKLTCPMEIIPNGITPEEFSDLPAPGTFSAAHPELRGVRYILFLSRLHFKKGLDILADAFAILAQKNSEIHLVVAGPDDGVATAFQSQIQSAGLSSRVHAVGPLFGKDKLAALVDAACFCLPSRQEGFSLAILEAMACSLPVVISSECHFPEVAEHGAGEVVPLNAAAFAAALERVLTNPGEMGRVGREMVFDRFTWPKVATMLTAAYERYGA